MGILRLLRYTARLKGARSLERSMSEWQIYADGARRIHARGSMKEVGTMRTSIPTAELSVQSAFISQLGLVNLCILLLGVSRKKRDPLLCFSIASQSLVSSELLTSDPSLGYFLLHLSTHDMMAV